MRWIDWDFHFGMNSNFLILQQRTAVLFWAESVTYPVRHSGAVHSTVYGIYGILLLFCVGVGLQHCWLERLIVLESCQGWRLSPADFCKSF